MKPAELWTSILIGSGISPSQETIDRLARFQTWLGTEAIDGGGLSPHEIGRLGERHIADSLLYAQFLDWHSPVVDIGSGVGLPGIPLAIARPDLEFRCLDRSGRRVDLANRAIRILGLDNVSASRESVEDTTDSFPQLVSRAMTPPDRIRPLIERILQPGGRAIVGGSWKQAPVVEGFTTLEIGEKILSKPVWILMMTGT